MKMPKLLSIQMRDIQRVDKIQAEIEQDQWVKNKEPI